jgi:hypothetical protein
MTPPRRVCIETPLRGNTLRNVLYADACMYDALTRGEAPFLGHLLYPRVLDDADEAQRRAGIEAHCAWLRAAQLIVIYTDLGISGGMREVELADSLKIPREFRNLGVAWHRTIAGVNGTSDFLRVPRPD